MIKLIRLSFAALALCVSVSIASADTISGKVLDSAGEAMEGVMVSAFDRDHRVSTSVFSQADGSFIITNLRDTTFDVRARLLGQLDQWQNGVKRRTNGVAFAMEPAKGELLERQRTADSALGMLKWENQRDRDNFKNMCTYCHQIGTLGFRSPEEPVDWETMIVRMDGFGGLFKHTQKNIVDRLLDTFSDEAVAEWPEFVPPPAPTGAATQVKITEWDMGNQDAAMIHDMELGSDGLIYSVDMSRNGVATLDPITGAREFYTLPAPYRGPHSIERANNGDMWITLCSSGAMAKFDVRTKEYTIASSAESGKPRGSYPHTLRINPKDPEGLIWYTDAGANAVFSMHPETMEATKYQLPAYDESAGTGRGETYGAAPYGIDFSPVDGKIWWSKLMGNRIGVIDPTVEGGNIREWEPPFIAPRRLHVAPDGIVWVPGFASGEIGSFDPRTEEWEVFQMPRADNRTPYALNIDSNGIVWICGTGSDTILRFDPKIKEFVEFRLPSRVTYTREIEFGEDGSIWTCNSNTPARHTERGFGSIIKLELIGD